MPKRAIATQKYKVVFIKVSFKRETGYAEKDYNCAEAKGINKACPKGGAGYREDCHVMDREVCIILGPL